MLLYLLLPLPALAAAIWSSRLSRFGLVLLWAAIGVGIAVLMPVGSRDYSNYLRDYADLNALSIDSLPYYDPLYTLVVWIFGHIGVPGEAFYLLLSLCGLWVKLTALHKLGRGSSLVVLLYMCSYFFTHEFTQLRAGLAIGIWMHALASLNQSPRRYLLLTSLATLVHIQAGLGFVLAGVLWFAKSRAIGRALTLVLLLLFGVASTGVFDRWGYTLLSAVPDPRAQIYLELAEQDIWVRPNPFSVVSLVALLTAVVGLSRRIRPAGLGAASVQLFPAISSPQAAVFFGLLLGACALALLSVVSVAAFRISEHFFALLPVGAWLAALGDRERPRHVWTLWLLAVLLVNIFVFHSPYLLDPATGETTRSDT